MIITPRQFAVIASQRTGSTLLIRSLDTSPDILCAGEIFHAGPGVHQPGFQFPYRCLGSRRLARLLNLTLTKRRVENHLQWFYESAGHTVAAIGFKLMVSHIKTFPAVMPFLQQNGVAFFYLYRKDVFATALSFYRAKVSGVYHSDKPSPRRSPISVPADEDQFDRLVEVCQRDKQHLHDLQQRYGGRSIAYEDMISSWNDIISAIGGDIGLPQLRVQKSLSRMGGDHMSVIIENEQILRDKYEMHSAG